MALTTCKECSAAISTKAVKCPKCGAPKKKKTSVFTWLVTIILIFWLIGYIGQLSTTPTQKPTQASSKVEQKSVTADEVHHVFSYKKATEQSGETSWIFEGENKPPLNVSDKLEFVRNVNSALNTIGLPTINRSVPERESLTGSRIHRGEFLWDDYQKGPLLIHRNVCRDSNYKNYDCIWKITVGNLGLPVTASTTKCQGADGNWYPYSHPICSGGVTDSSRTTSTAKKALSDSGGQRITGDNYFGCTDREYRDKLTSAVADKDMDAFKNGLMAALVTGQCIMFTPGEEVFLTDTAIFSGLVKVRRRGEMPAYWVNIEAVK